MNKDYYEQTWSRLIKIGIGRIFTQNPIDHIEPEQKTKEGKETFIIYNKDCSFPHDNLNPMSDQLGKYLHTTV